MSTFSIPTWNKFAVLGEGVSDEDVGDIGEYEGAPFDEHFEVYEQVEESHAPCDDRSKIKMRKRPISGLIGQIWTRRKLNGETMGLGNHLVIFSLIGKNWRRKRIAG